MGVESVMLSGGLLAARLSGVIISIWTFHFILTNGLRRRSFGVQGRGVRLEREVNPETLSSFFVRWICCSFVVWMGSFHPYVLGFGYR